MNISLKKQSTLHFHGKVSTVQVRNKVQQRFTFRVMFSFRITFKKLFGNGPTRVSVKSENLKTT